MRSMDQKLSDRAGVPIYRDNALERYEALYGNGEITMRWLHAAKLSKWSVKYGKPKRAVAMAIFILAHEMGHHYDATHGRPYSEETANDFAYNNFRRIAQQLGASKERAMRLADTLPSGWVK